MQTSRIRAGSESIRFPPDMMQLWKLEGELLSCIVTLDFLNGVNERGEIHPEIFHRQIKTLLKGAIKSRIQLENSPVFSFESFVTSAKLADNYPMGLYLLQMAEGTGKAGEIDEALEKINYSEVTKLPAKAADFVATGIELLDLLRLEDIATVDRILPLLDEIRAIFSATALFGDDFWATKEVDEWIRVLNKRRPGTLLPNELAEKLELQSVRWLNAFRRELKNL
ncbi:MAG: hypothetical protein ACXAB4_06425 [Candidatus Hodarchaeales archaeon]|jgi:hypothetical protein